MTNPTDPTPAGIKPDGYELAPKRSGGTRNALTVVLVLLAIAVLFYQRLGGIGLPAKPDHIAWQTDIAKALADSKVSGKPVLVDFSATWCAPCQEMKRKSWPDPRVQQLVADKYIAVFLDVDQPSANEASHKYVIEYLPSVLILDGDGKVLQKGEYMDPKDLADFLSKGATLTRPPGKAALQALAQ